MEPKWSPKGVQPGFRKVQMDYTVCVKMDIWHLGNMEYGNGVEIQSKWSPSGVAMESKMDSKWNPNGVQIESKCSPNGVAMESQMESEIQSKWS